MLSQLENTRISNKTVLLLFFLWGASDVLASRFSSVSLSRFEPHVTRGWVMFLGLCSQILIWSAAETTWEEGFGVIYLWGLSFFLFLSKRGARCLSKQAKQAGLAVQHYAVIYHRHSWCWVINGIHCCINLFILLELCLQLRSDQVLYNMGPHLALSLFLTGTCEANEKLGLKHK